MSREPLSIDDAINLIKDAMGLPFNAKITLIDNDTTKIVEDVLTASAVYVVVVNDG